MKPQLRSWPQPRSATQCPAQGEMEGIKEERKGEIQKGNPEEGSHRKAPKLHTSAWLTWLPRAPQATRKQDLGGGTQGMPST